MIACHIAKGNNKIFTCGSFLGRQNIPTDQFSHRNQCDRSRKIQSWSLGLECFFHDIYLGHCKAWKYSKYSLSFLAIIDFTTLNHKEHFQDSRTNCQYCHLFFSIAFLFHEKIRTEKGMIWIKLFRTPHSGQSILGYSCRSSNSHSRLV